jgi:hypothetical protein
MDEPGSPGLGCRSICSNLYNSANHPGMGAEAPHQPAGDPSTRPSDDLARGDGVWARALPPAAAFLGPGIPAWRHGRTGPAPHSQPARPSRQAGSLPLQPPPRASGTPPAPRFPTAAPEHRHPERSGLHQYRHPERSGLRGRGVEGSPEARRTSRVTATPRAYRTATPHRPVGVPDATPAPGARGCPRKALNRI